MVWGRGGEGGLRESWGAGSARKGVAPGDPNEEKEWKGREEIRARHEEMGDGEGEGGSLKENSTQGLWGKRKRGAQGRGFED